MARYDKRTTRHSPTPKSLNPDSQEYWEAILRQEGLSMARGQSSKLSYHSPRQIEKIDMVRQGDKFLCGGGKRIRPAPRLDEQDNDPQ